jgi:hypothetical protein
MPAISDVLIPSTTYPLYASGPQTLVGDQYKGDGFYGWGDGLHTVCYNVSGFVGHLQIQASLATNPADSDFFNVDNTLYGDDTNPLTDVKIYNFTGNFVWIRVVGTFKAGTVISVLYNH